VTEPSPEIASENSEADPAPVAAQKTTRKSRKADKKPLPVWQESILLLAIALILAIGIKFFFIQAFYIPSPSMEPLFVKNDRILVQKVSYWFGGSPSRGDIVVFKDPGNWLPADESSSASNPFTKTLEAVGLYPSGGHLVKRVIGVGGDTVTCDPSKDQGRLEVNGHALNEKSYLPDGTAPCSEPFTAKVPAGHLWVMGDNRGDSSDSRAHQDEPGHGFVDDDLVVGKVWSLIWPWSRAKWIHTPATFKGIPNP